MSTTFVNTIDNNPIYADRALNDKDGNQIDTTYLKTANIPVSDVTLDGSSVVNGQGVAVLTSPTDLVPTVTNNDNGKVLKATYSGGTGSYSWEAESGGGGADVYYISSTDTNDDVYQAYKAGKILMYTPYTDGGWMHLHMRLSHTQGGYKYFMAECDRAGQSNTTYTSGYLNTYVSEIAVSSSTDHADSNVFNPTSKYIMLIDMPLATNKAGKVLAVNSGVTALEWIDPASTAPVQDVTVNGSSVINNSTAEITLPTIKNLIAGTGITITETAQGIVIALA